MRIPRALLDEMLAHARADAPDECCGLMALRDGEVVETHRVRNIAPSRPMAFEMDPDQLVKLWPGIEDAGYDMALYHSHTRTDPVPSQTDINESRRWPGSDWLILGVKSADDDVRAWRIDGGKPIELPVEVV